MMDEQQKQGLQSWASIRLSELEPYLLPHYREVQELRAAGVGEARIRALYPDEWEDGCRLLAYNAAIELKQAIGIAATERKQVSEIVRPQSVEQKAVRLLADHTLRVREVTVTLDYSEMSRPLIKSWNRVVDTSDLAPACNTLQLAIHLLQAFAEGIEVNGGSDMQSRWDENFPHYQRLMTELNHLLRNKGWFASNLST